MKELGQVLFELLLKIGRILDRVEDGLERTIGTVTPPLNELVEGTFLGQTLLDLGFVLQGNHRGAVLPIDQQIGNTPLPVSVERVLHVVWPMDSKQRPRTNANRDRFRRQGGSACHRATGATGDFPGLPSAENSAERQIGVELRLKPP